MTSTAGTDAWDRLAHVWHGLFAATMAVPTAVALFADGPSSLDRFLVVTLVAGLALWHWLVLVRHPEWWKRRLAAMACYWAVAAVLSMLLVNLHHGYAILLYGMYPLMCITLGWWARVPVVGLTTALVAWVLGDWAASPGVVFNVLATSGVALVLAVFVDAITSQSEQRRDALAELATTRTQFVETARHAGVLEERERLARDLHDTIAQSFTSIVTQLEAAEQASDGRPRDAHGHLVAARRAARDGLDEVRRCMHALRPDLLEEASLSQAMERTLRRWSCETGVRAELRTTGERVALHPETETALLRTVQEALTNVARHAGANRVIVSLSYLDDTVTLDVNDDGVGFPSSAVRCADGRFGLIGMGERIAGVGGDLSIESEPGQGTTIAVSVSS